MYGGRRRRRFGGAAAAESPSREGESRMPQPAVAGRPPPTMHSPLPEMSTEAAVTPEAGRAAVRARHDRPLPPGAASRTALVNRLRSARSHRLATVVAPAGYGKTTVLLQWAARDDRAFAIVPLGGRDDVVGLVERVAEALGESIRDEDAATALVRIASLWMAPPEPLVLVFDDAHLLGGDASFLVTALIDATPHGSMVVLAGRGLPRLTGLSFPRLRARGHLLELGAEDLILTRREARAVLQLRTPLPEPGLDVLLEE